jgi:hypothetical protein
LRKRTIHSRTPPTCRKNEQTRSNFADGTRVQFRKRTLQSAGSPPVNQLYRGINDNIRAAGSARPWLKFDVYNVLNDEKQLSWNTNMAGRQAGARSAWRSV